MSEKPENHPQHRPSTDDPKPSRRGGLLFLLLVFFTILILVDVAILAYWLLPWRKQAPVAPPAVETPARTPPAPSGW